ncbi:hypothetical protein HYW75_03680 [Candidatus Pacearchaeota archaeon]|nr:hypothetical protein [Candidatus Pacearchaeota archaeon]
MDREHIEHLTQIGLTEGEAKVYLTLLELGSSTVGPIAYKAGVAYSNIYEILERLIEKGIISYIIKSKTKYFQASSPSNLRMYLDNKENEIMKKKELLRELLPFLNKMKRNFKNQESEVFIGKKGLRTAYEQLLYNIGKMNEELFFYIHDSRYSEEADAFYFSIQNILKKISIRGISNDAARNSDFLKKANYIKMRYTNFPVPGNIEVSKDKTLLVSWEKPIIATLIKSSSIANNFRTYFNEVWKVARK